MSTVTTSAFIEQPDDVLSHNAGLGLFAGLPVALVLSAMIWYPIGWAAYVLLY